MWPRGLAVWHPWGHWIDNHNVTQSFVKTVPCGSLVYGAESIAFAMMLTLSCSYLHALGKNRPFRVVWLHEWVHTCRVCVSVQMHMNEFSEENWAWELKPFKARSWGQEKRWENRYFTAMQAFLSFPGPKWNAGDWGPSRQRGTKRLSKHSQSSLFVNSVFVTSPTH